MFVAMDGGDKRTRMYSQRFSEASPPTHSCTKPADFRKEKEHQSVRQNRQQRHSAAGHRQRHGHTLGRLHQTDGPRRPRLPVRLPALRTHPGVPAATGPQTRHRQPFRRPESPRLPCPHPPGRHRMHGDRPHQPAAGHRQRPVLRRADTGDGAVGRVLPGKLTPLSVTAVFSGFAGIIVILRPVEFNWAVIAALGSAFALAINAVMVRQLPKEQTTVHKLFLNYLLIIPAAAALAFWEGATWNLQIMVSAAGSALFILGYNITVLLAYRQVDANQVTSAEYTGLIWAVAIGWIWFGEVPDLWFLAGSMMIVVPLVLIGLRHRRRRSPARGFNPASRETPQKELEPGFSGSAQ